MLPTPVTLYKNNFLRQTIFLRYTVVSILLSYNLLAEIPGVARDSR
jgi:uncharacterized membrane protein YesL